MLANTINVGKAERADNRLFRGASGITGRHCQIAGQSFSRFFAFLFAPFLFGIFGYRLGLGKILHHPAQRLIALFLQRFLAGELIDAFWR